MHPCVFGSVVEAVGISVCTVGHRRPSVSQVEVWTYKTSRSRDDELR